jgi:hypothetical protein
MSKSSKKQEGDPSSWIGDRLRYRSYVARYQAIKPDGLLLGAVKRAQSSRYSKAEDAASYLATAIENNGGPENCRGEVLPQAAPANIIRHCHPSIAQTIGGKCFRCSKVLTMEDSKKECLCIGSPGEPHEEAAS